MNRILFTLILFAMTLSVSVYGQDIVSGPMLGYNELRQVAIWTQTSKGAEVYVKYRVEGNKSTYKKSAKVRTKKEDGFTAHLLCSNLEPSTLYEYVLVLDDKEVPGTHQFQTQTLWQYRTDPPNFSFAVGSCAFINEEKYDHPGKGYGDKYEVFESIHSKNPDLMLWLGDNIYLREVDLNTKSGFIYRYSDMRKLPEMQSLLSGCHHYAIWDDHDYGPNDSNMSFVHKDISKECFELFWANNGYALGKDEGIYGQFSYNDIDYFLLDNRSFRTDFDLKGQDISMLGQEQINWFIQALKYSKAPFKIVCIGGQFLSDAKVYENYARYEEERQKVIDLITANNIKGVVFLSGDRHMASLSQMKLENGNYIYDFTVSPLTSTSYDNCNEGNSYQIDGTCYPDKNFSIIKVSGTIDDRQLNLSLFDSTGQLIWSRVIRSDYELESN